jgi:hypothetical protein
MANALSPGDVHSQRLGLAQIEVQFVVSVLGSFQPTAARNLGKDRGFRSYQPIRPYDAYVALRTLKMRSSVRLDQARINFGFSYHTSVSQAAVLSGRS